MRRAARSLGLAALLCGAPATGQDRVVEAGVHALRMGSRPEWVETASVPHARALVAEFDGAAAAAEWTLSLYQADVKQRWRVSINGRPVATLHQDENPMVTYWPVPAGVVVAGRNTLRVEAADTLADDVRVGRIALRTRPLREVLSEAAVEVEVVSAESGVPLPARLTVTDAEGALHAVGVEPGASLAARPGMVYTGSGRASLRLPAGVYRVYAGRGFEYGVDSARLVLGAGETARRTLRVAREVPTPGWVAMDTHVHTFTHSGHGDATLEERAVTVAGEGVEVPVLTDHNIHADLAPAAGATGVRAHFTPVPGNELTTPVGHFNLFPVPPGMPAPAARLADWAAVSRAVEGVPGVRAVVLNHARDVHAGFRPFGPERHLSSAGASVDGWALPANAMEVLNSGSQQADPMRLFADWFGALNRGLALTPVGSSDSHDVARYLVGQGRTYVRAGDADPGRIDVGAVMESFRAGRVMVSFGLLAEVTVDGRYGPGDLAPAGGEVEVLVRVLGPAWTRAERVTLYSNGMPVHSFSVPRGTGAGPKWTGAWKLPRPAHDVFLVAVAEGPGEHRPFWPIAKPYQPITVRWVPRVIGASGAVWLDGDGDGRRTDARAYAARLLAEARGDAAALVAALAPYDAAVAVQAAALLRERGVDPAGAELSPALERAAPATRRGFATFAAEWRASEAARLRAP